MFAGCLPDGEQDALAFVIARTVLVRLAEVAQRDGAINSAEDFADANLCGRTGQHVATADATLRAHQASAFQRKQDLFQVWLGERSAFGDVAHGGRHGLLVVQRQREQRPTRIVALTRNTHKGIVVP